MTSSSPSCTGSSTDILPTFHPFSRLPIEIRNLIWKFMLPPKRLLRIMTLATANLGESFYVDSSSYNHNQPVLLSICREARAEALQHLQLIFDCYWNLKIDIPLLAKHGGMDVNLKSINSALVQEKILRHVKLVAVEARLGTVQRGHIFGHLRSSFKVFHEVENIQEIILVTSYRTKSVDDGSTSHQQWELKRGFSEFPAATQAAWEEILTHTLEEDQLYYTESCAKKGARSNGRPKIGFGHLEITWPGKSWSRRNLETDH
ncbi:hypothetical protein BGZ60DRAFT_161605 [Tricladium varicosporioides]|nr:hypothetical protein BGZ60DRAFT_161605 [Hymenoscyphus varicosporioides]